MPQGFQLIATGGHGLAALNSHSIGLALAVPFFGCSCVALGDLAYTSGLFPRVLGVMMVLTGACYLTNSTAPLLSPRLASILFPAILVPASSASYPLQYD